jgi:hypothetical protein
VVAMADLPGDHEAWIGEVMHDDGASQDDDEDDHCVGDGRSGDGGVGKADLTSHCSPDLLDHSDRSIH